MKNELKIKDEVSGMYLEYQNIHQNEKIYA